jgi:hypothetical protein
MGSRAKKYQGELNKKAKLLVELIESTESDLDPISDTLLWYQALIQASVSMRIGAIAAGVWPEDMELLHEKASKVSSDHLLQMLHPKEKD